MAGPESQKTATTATYRCGCKATWEPASLTVRIAYCPMREAAPDLLEACERIVSVMSPGTAGGAAILARAAIAKAMPVEAEKERSDE